MFLGITMYQRCLQIMGEVRKSGYDRRIGWEKLAAIIRRVGGSKPETIKAYRKELQVLGFIKSDNQLVFDIIQPEDKIK